MDIGQGGEEERQGDGHLPVSRFGITMIVKRRETLPVPINSEKDLEAAPGVCLARIFSMFGRNTFPFLHGQEQAQIFLHSCAKLNKSEES